MRTTLRNCISVIILSCCLISCVKSGEDCPTPASLTIETNGPVVAGWELKLESSIQGMGYFYHWTGPNGWTMKYETYASDAYLQFRENVTVADAGEYKLQLVNSDGCVEYEGSVNVEVVAAPNPPCNIAANTSTSSIAGVGDYNFVYRSFSPTSSFFNVTGRETVPGDVLDFTFLGQQPPLPGIYKTEGYFPTENGRVGLYINSFSVEFVALPNQTVYVNRVNNKLQVSFCAVKFTNPISPANPITISAKIIQP